MAHARPAGFSDSSDDDDEGMDYCETGHQSSLKISQPLPPPPPKQEPTNDIPSTITSSSSSSSPAFGGGLGRGRGRGLGNISSPIVIQSPAPPPQLVEESPPRNWSGGVGGSSCGGGRGRGSSSSRHRRRSGSSSPTLSSSGADKRKLKEALLKKVPDFGEVLKQELWAREVSKNLKAVWELDQKQLKPEWKKFGDELQRAFQLCREEKTWNVPNFALFLTINSSDFLAPQGGKNQAQAVLNGLTYYIHRQSTSPSSPPNPLHTFSVPLQEVAFEAAVFQRKESLLKLILESFQLTTSSSTSPQLKSYLLSEIAKLIKSKDYTEACFCANHLRLHSSFDIHSFLIPLILQDRPAVVEDFLELSPSHQRDLIKFLDSQFESGGNNGVFGNLLRYKGLHKIPNTKDDKLNHKPISKLIKRLRTKYNLGFDVCPNIGHRQRFGELRHLFARRYEKNEMSAESFAELIDQLSQESATIKEDIINHYLDYMDYLACARFIISHKLYDSVACQNQGILRYLPEPWKGQWEAKLRRNLDAEDECWEMEDTPSGAVKNGAVDDTQKAIDELHSGAMTSRWVEGQEAAALEEEGWREMEESRKRQKRKQYFCHPFPRSLLYILEEPYQILQLCETLAQANQVGNSGGVGGGGSGGNLPPVAIVSGFDSEWKPIMSKTSGAALLQLAFEDSVHLVDLVSLKENLKKVPGGYQGPCVWKALRKDYFENESILKLGFDLRNDVKMLTETVVQWKGMNGSWRRMLDLSSLKSLILKECPHLFSKEEEDGGNPGGESGLSELVFLCTGQSLSKEEQMSDWEKRPLREPQVLYAASDAYCLIRIYRVLEGLCKRKGVNLERIMGNYFKGQAGGGGGGQNGGDTGGAGGGGSKKKKSSVEIVLDLLPRLSPGDVGGGGGGTKGNTGDVKLVVDTMLLGLGRYLRCLGFDTVLLGNNEGHECCINYVRRERRRIITRGLQAYRRIQERLDREGEEDMMYLVKSESTASQLEEICNHFGVALRPSRLFTICHRCNTNQFITVSPDLMYRLMEIAGCHLLKSSTSSPSPSPQGQFQEESLQLFKSRSLDDMILFEDEGMEVTMEETKRCWTLLGEDTLQISDGARTVLTPRGEKVELTRLQMVSHLMDNVFICNGCGKCYWSSGRLEKFLRENNGK